jgi:hypothetical protein
MLSQYGLKGDRRERNQFLMPTPQNEIEPDEPSPLSSIGSLEAIDRLEEDPNRSEDTRATGVMGKSSEISWMQRVQREAEQRARGNPGTLETNPTDDEEKEAFSLHALNYHLDDLDISVPEPVQLYAMPPRQLADRLFDDYFQKTHPFFPILSKQLFRGQYQAFLDTSSQRDPVRPGDKWLAVLNIIFAIGAKHAHLTNAAWRGEDNDHLVYLTRARLLSMNSDVLFSHPDLQQVQVEGLIAFYLLASDQINRCVSFTTEHSKRLKLINIILIEHGEYLLWPYGRQSLSASTSESRAPKPPASPKRPATGYGGVYTVSSIC